MLFPDTKLLSDDDKRRLRECAPLIIDNLIPYAVIQSLKSCNAINLHQYEDIKAERARWRQVEKICDFVSMGSQYTFDMFMKALNDSGQAHIATAICDKQQRKLFKGEYKTIAKTTRFNVTRTKSLLPLRI